jgi:hypothetical protein
VRRWQPGSGGQLGGEGNSLAEAQFWRLWQRAGERGGSATAAAAAAATWHWQCQRGVC